jgi:hypothetical protein
MRATVPTLEVSVLGIGLLGPGLADWATAAQVLAGSQPWQQAPTMIPPPARLPPTERRRAGAIVKLAFAVAEQAVAAAGADASTLATVFTSSSADTANCHALCEALAQPTRIVSPTRFTNSVHNAAAGYWHIAAGSRAASTSLAAFDGSFGAGLLEAATQVVAGGQPALLVAADLPYPQPLQAARPLPDAFGVALVLAPAGAPGAVARLGLSLRPGDAVLSVCTDSGLDALRRTVPSARGLPLLQALAHGAAGVALSLDYLEGLALGVHVNARTGAGAGAGAGACEDAGGDRGAGGTAGAHGAAGAGVCAGEGVGMEGSFR